MERIPDMHFNPNCQEKQHKGEDDHVVENACPELCIATQACLPKH